MAVLLREGDLVGRYTISTRVGLGGMASVYKARNQDSSSYRALKVRHDPRTMPIDENSLRREYDVWKQLKHLSGITRVEEYFKFRGLEVLVMKLYQQSLLHLQLTGHRNGKIPLIETFRVAERMLGVLQGVHMTGILHCDVKGENILVDQGSHGLHYYLADFGSYEVYTDNSRRHVPPYQTEDLIGTVTYRSLATSCPAMSRSTGKVTYLAHSRRDDMESLAYTLLSLLDGLPWVSLHKENDVYEMKRKFPERRDNSIPSVFYNFLAAQKELEWDTLPAYAAWTRVFRDARKATEVNETHRARQESISSSSSAQKPTQVRAPSSQSSRSEVRSHERPAPEMRRSSVGSTSRSRPEASRPTTAASLTNASAAPSRDSGRKHRSHSRSGATPTISPYRRPQSHESTRSRAPTVTAPKPMVTRPATSKSPLEPIQIYSAAVPQRGRPTSIYGPPLAPLNVGPTPSSTRTGSRQSHREPTPVPTYGGTLKRGLEGTNMSHRLPQSHRRRDHTTPSPDNSPSLRHTLAHKAQTFVLRARSLVSHGGQNPTSQEDFPEGGPRPPASKRSHPYTPPPPRSASREAVTSHTPSRSIAVRSEVTRHDSARQALPINLMGGPPKHTSVDTMHLISSHDGDVPQKNEGLMKSRESTAQHRAKRTLYGPPDSQSLSQTELKALSPHKQMFHGTDRPPERYSERERRNPRLGVGPVKIIRSTPLSAKRGWT